MYVYTQDVPIDLETYGKVVEALGPEPIEGSLLHLCVRRPDGGLRYIEVWESLEACTRAFEERIHAAVDRAFGGRRPPGEPSVEHLEVLYANGSMLPPADDNFGRGAIGAAAHPGNGGGSAAKA